MMLAISRSQARSLSSALPLLFAILLTSGCASYVTPSGRADLHGISSASMKESFAAEPAAQFPASIVAVRVQSSHYRSYSTERHGGVYGSGKYSVITAKEVEENSALESLARMPDVGGFITLSRLLLPETLQSDRELREAAARLKADMVLLYTFDTSFHKNDLSTALNVISLGLSPTRKITMRVTASALLIDTRTGFIYAALEANEKRQALSNAWESKESAAFKSLVNEFEKTWPSVVARGKKGA